MRFISALVFAGLAALRHPGPGPATRVPGHAGRQGRAVFPGENDPFADAARP